MTPAEWLTRCADRRAHEASVAAAQPDLARRRRRFAAERGWVCTFDDPMIQLRCSEVEALARQALGQPEPAPVPDHDQLALDLPPGRP